MDKEIYNKRHKRSGHSVLMGKTKNDWQDIEWVLRLFGKMVIEN